MKRLLNILDISDDSEFEDDDEEETSDNENVDKRSDTLGRADDGQIIYHITDIQKLHR